MNEKNIYSARTLKFCYRVIQDNGNNPDLIFLNSGIDKSIFDRPDDTISFEQKNTISRNMAHLSSDPLMGLKMGEAFSLDEFGTLGYAALCARTRGDAMKIMINHQVLSGSYFKISFTNHDEKVSVNLAKLEDIPDDLFAYYCDIETSAVVFCEGSRQENIDALESIELMHNRVELKKEYEDFFQCPVTFNAPMNKITFRNGTQNRIMPRSDVQTSEICLLQCEKIISQLKKSSSLVEKVRQAVLAEAGVFPSIAQISKQLNTSERTLRRRLSEEGSSYQKILNEVRFQLAKDYLKTELSIDQISELVGYSEAANFSHAFKRWTSLSPNDYRRSLN